MKFRAIVILCGLGLSLAGCGGYEEPSDADIAHGLVASMDGVGGLEKIAEGTLQSTAPGGWNTIRIDVVSVAKHSCAKAESGEGYICDFTADIRQSIGDGEGMVDQYSAAWNTVFSAAGVRGGANRQTGRFYKTGSDWMFAAQ